MRGPCAKTKVVCLIARPDGKFFRGENDCENPQEVCPRDPGEDYTKCKTICNQGGHAEMDALRCAEGYSLQGATAIVYGHSYACQSCQEALFGAGIKWLRVNRDSL